MDNEIETMREGIAAKKALIDSLNQVDIDDCRKYFDVIKMLLSDIKISGESQGRCFLPSQKLLWECADNHGWHNPACDLPTALLLIHSEVSEACEAAREDKIKYSETDTSVEEELADVIIRIMDTAQQNGFDMEKAVWSKYHKNLDRPYRHGGKKF